MNTGIEVRLLGPLEVAVPAGAVEFEGAKQRRLFVALALRAPEAVSVDELVEAVWGDAGARRPRPGAAEAGLAPARARSASSCRCAGAPPGYALEIEREAIDSRRFETLLRARAVARPTPRDAAGRRRSRCGAGRRWPTTASTSSPRARSRGWRSCGWRRSRSGSRPSWRAAHAADLVGELRALVAEHPLRERLRGPADARALPRRPPGGRARGDARGPPAAGRGARARARARSCASWSAMILAHDPELDAEAPADVLDAPLPAPRQRDDRPRGRAGRDRRAAHAPRRPPADTRRAPAASARRGWRSRPARDARRRASRAAPPTSISTGVEGGARARRRGRARAWWPRRPPSSASGSRAPPAARRALLVLDGFERFLADAAPGRRRCSPPCRT